MSTINLEKVDKFYFVFVLVMVLMAVLVVATFQGIFSSYIDAFDIDQEEIGVDLVIDKEKLDQTHSWAFNKETVSLEIRQ